jgi:hypothetical protein
MSDYPEHDKLTAIKDESQSIGEFIETSGYILAQYREAGDNGQPPYVWRPWADKEEAPTVNDYADGRAKHNPAYESWGEHLVPVGLPITQILAAYFDIDLRKIEDEKRTMLDQLRAANA